MSDDKIPLPRIQAKKIRNLLEKGGVVDSVTVRVNMNGKVATVDKWGRVTWFELIKNGA